MKPHSKPYQSLRNTINQRNVFSESFKAFQNITLTSTKQLCKFLRSTKVSYISPVTPSSSLLKGWHEEDACAASREFPNTSKCAPVSTVLSPAVSQRCWWAQAQHILIVD